MQISSLISKNNRVQVFIDNTYSFSCSFDFVLENNLFKGKVVTKEVVDKLALKSESDILKGKLMEYIYSKPYSKRELINKLDSYSRKKYKKPLDKNIFENIFEVIVSKGYFNNSENINKWVTHYLDKNKGLRYIVQKLSQKGYESKEVETVVKALESNENSEDVIVGLLDKKLSGVNEISLKLKAKVIRYLLSQGFNYTQVNKAYKEYIGKNKIKEVKEG